MGITLANQFSAHMARLGIMLPRHSPCPAAIRLARRSSYSRQSCNDSFPALRENPGSRTRTFSVPENRTRLDSRLAVNSVELPATGYVEWLAGEAVLITFASVGFHSRMETFFAFARLLKRERERLKRTVQTACQPDQPCDRPPQTELPVDPPESLRLASACQSLDH